ncbi:serine/threonine-protein kinase [Micromonospora maritima]|uniref:serine/threonine-protein kinase n=1 Tax=Micromonospora maritima TaxID=986711 RepID=UPI0037A2CA0C
MREVVIAGRYRLLELVGRGGMGQVWRARDDELHREVAVKQVVPPNWLAEHERDELRARTLREARTAARLSHPNVVRVYDVVRVQGDPWLIMEYVPSRSLQEIIESDGPLPPRRAAGIGLAVLAGLRAAHDAGVLHRDVKPANVLLARDGRVLLTDFGLAVFEGGDGAMTRPGLVLGSPQYVAPERAAEGASSVEADLWSLGATLHAAVEGRSPYARSTAMATLAALASQPPDPAPHAGPLMPVLVGLLRRDPRNRLGHDETARLLTAATAPDADAPDRSAAGTSGRPAAGTSGWSAAGTSGWSAGEAPDPPAPAAGVPDRVPVGAVDPPDRSDVPDRTDPDGWDSTGTAAGPPVDYPDLMPPAAAARAWSRAALRSEWAPPADADPTGSSPAPVDPGGPVEPGRPDAPVRTSAGGPTRDTTDRPSGSLGPTVLTSFVDPGSPTGPAGPSARADALSPVHTGGQTSPAPVPAPVTHGGAVGTGAPPGGPAGSGALPGNPAGSGALPGAPARGGAVGRVPARSGSPGHGGEVGGGAGAGGVVRSGTAPGGVDGEPRAGGAGREARAGGADREPPAGGAGRTAARRWGLAATAVVLAVAAGVGTALAVTDDHAHPPDADGRGDGPRQPWERPPGPPGGPGGVPAPPFPCIRPDVAGTPVQKGPPPADPAVTLPAGWVWPADTGGFHIALPAGWLQLRSGDTTCFQDPATRRILGVEPYPGGDPVGRLRSSERDLTSAGRLPQYQKVRLAGDGDAAEWECRWTAPYGERMHALRVLPGEEAGWTLGWTTSDADWPAAAEQFALIRESIRPIRPTRTAG